MKKISKKILGFLIFIGVMFIFGFGLGFIMGVLDIDPELGLGGFTIWRFFTSILKLMVYFYISIILHELGHLIFGLATGYSFMSFRVGGTIFIKSDDRIRIKKYNIPGTGGQCLLSPPDMDEDGNFPYKLYNLGGGLVNILIFIISIIFLIKIDGVMKLDFLIFGILNLLSGAFNLIPFSSKLNNDGKNQVLLRKKSNRLYFWKSLKINEGLTKGIDMRDMDKFLFEYREEDENTAFKDGIVIANVNYQIARGKYSLARESINNLLARRDLIDLYKQELRCDLLFLDILDGNKQELEALMTKDLQKYIGLTEKYFIQRKRLMYGYYLLIEDDFDRAAEKLSDFNKMERSYPYLAEIELERDYINRINLIYEGKNRVL